MSLSPVINISGDTGVAYYSGADVWFRWVCPNGRGYSFDTRADPSWTPGFDGNFDFATNIDSYVRQNLGEPNSVGDLFPIDFSVLYQAPHVFPQGYGNSPGAWVAFQADTDGVYWFHVTARNGGSGCFAFRWQKWAPFSLARCNSCPPDWQSEVCVADWQLEHLDTNILHLLGSFPAGNYKLRSCRTDLTLNGIVVICGPYFEQFRGTFNVWNDDQAYPAQFTLYDWVRELGGFGAYYNTQTGCADYYWQSDANWEAISGTGPLSSIPPGLVGQPNPYPDESSSVVCAGAKIDFFPWGSGTPGHQNLNYSPCTSYPAGRWLGSYTVVLTQETGITIPDSSSGPWSVPAHAGCAVLVTLDGFDSVSGNYIARTYSWDLLTYQWTGRRATANIPPHRPYCGSMWLRVDHPLPPQPCSETGIFCHPGGQIGVAYAGAVFRSMDFGAGNPIVRLVDVNAGVKYSLTTERTSEMGFATLTSTPEKGLSLRLFFQTLTSAIPMTWDWYLEAQSGSFGTGNVSSGQVTLVPGAPQNVFALLDYGVNAYENGSVGPTYPLVMDLVFTDPCSGNEVARLAGYTITPVVAVKNLGFLKDTCGLNDGYIYLQFQNSGNAFLRSMTVTATATARQIGWVDINQDRAICTAPVTFGPTATGTFYNHGQALDLALRVKGTGATRITITATDRGEAIPPLIIDL